jgi:hypothetical protein
MRARAIRHAGEGHRQPHAGIEAQAIVAPQKVCRELGINELGRTLAGGLSMLVEPYSAPA